MLDNINRYLHGYVAIPVIIACREYKIFNFFQIKKHFSLIEIVNESNANEGYLQASLQMFESLGWLRCDGNVYHNLMTEEDVAAIHLIPKSILSFYDVPIKLLMRNFQFQKTLSYWLHYLGINKQKNRHSHFIIKDFFPGAVIVPFLIALKEGNFISNDNYFILKELPEFLQKSILSFFLGKNWVEKRANEYLLTPSGRFMIERALNMGVTASYAPMLSQIITLLFGKFETVFKRDQQGTELNIVRALNVSASGFQHGKYFNDMIRIILSIFDEFPFHEQPKYIIDIGCGDGTLLKTIYEAICHQSARGRVISQYPLSMIGVDYNKEALEVTKVTLEGIPHYTLLGDIADPQRLIQNLKSLGIEDPEYSLHVRSFLDHDRPLVLPSNVMKIHERAHRSYKGVYINKEGKILPSYLVIQSLVEHLERWASIPTKYGIIILEVHHLSPEIVSAYRDQNESLHFDLLHSFSFQYLVEADVFLMSAAEGGLFPKIGFTKRYPQIFPYTRITLARFEKRDYLVRQAREKDIPRLVEIESYCCSEHMRSTEEALRARLKKFIEGQIVVEVGGEIVGVVYTQRIESIEILKQATFSNISTFSSPNGQFLQLLGINIVPEWQNKGLGDQLLEFVLLWASLKGGIEKVVGISSCRNYKNVSNLPMDEYIKRYCETPNSMDPILLFHTNRGANIIEVLPCFHPNDVENRRAGVLIEYDIHNEREFSKVAPQPQKEREHITNTIFLSQFVKDSLGSEKENFYSEETPLMEMGLDSVDLLSLRHRINTYYQVNLDTAFFLEYNTVAKIKKYFQGQQSHLETQKIAEGNIR